MFCQQWLTYIRGIFPRLHNEIKTVSLWDEVVTFDTVKLGRNVSVALAFTADIFTHRDCKARVAFLLHCNVPQCTRVFVKCYVTSQCFVTLCGILGTQWNKMWQQFLATEWCHVVTASNLLQSCPSSLQHWEIQGWEVEDGQQRPEYIIVKKWMWFWLKPKEHIEDAQK